MRKSELPFIHLFRTSLDHYFFDVNTDTIVKIPKEIYNKLNNFIDDYWEDEYIVQLRNMGLLQPNRKRITKHPETDYIDLQFDSCMKTLVLQVTQNCNQRCDYCVYSGKYENRVHNNSKMSFEIAKQGIDMVINHSRDSEKLFLGFYGGEPLLEEELIKKCIQYLDEKIEGKTVQYNITTNGTLLTQNIIDIFVSHNVSLMISLDGPAEVHNKHRKLLRGNGDSHSIIMKKLKYLKETYPIYYKEHVSFSTVFDGESDFESIDNFFNNSLFEGKNISAVSIADNYSKKEVYVRNEKFIEDTKYALFLNMLAIVGRIEEEKTSRLFRLQKEQIRSLRKGKCFGDKKSLTYYGHRSGGCVPGLHKLFLSVNGEFYPCEKVSECSNVCKIGNVTEGLDLEKIRRLANLQKITEEECLNCWAYDYCTICLAQADGLDEISKDLILKRCEHVKKNIDSLFKDYCLCEELINHRLKSSCS